MKERKKQSGKNFSATPFAQLKGVRPTWSALAVPEKPQPQVSPQAGEDDELFLLAMEGVKKLEVRPHAPDGAPRLRERAEERIEQEHQVFMQAVEALQLDVTFRDEFPQDEEARPLPVNRLRQLRRGKIRVDYELDLHGLCREEALKIVATFIAGAFRRGQRAVLIVTGKGNNSPGEPVLQKAVAEWLREKGQGMVTEFFPAPREMGGGGAIVVFLKERKGGENR